MILSTRSKPPSPVVLTLSGMNHLVATCEKQRIPARSFRKGLHTGGRRNAISTLGQAASTVTDHRGRHVHRVILSELHQRSSPLPSRCARRRVALPLPLATTADKKKISSTSVAHGEMATSLSFIEGSGAPLARSLIHHLEQENASKEL
jgi:hypothetical protein